MVMESSAPSDNLCKQTHQKHPLLTLLAASMVYRTTLFVNLALLLTVASLATALSWSKGRTTAEELKSFAPQEPHQSAVLARIFQQTLDHFDGVGEERLWQQRYWINTDNWGGPGAPIFLILGGEGPEDSSMVTRFQPSYYAKDHRALVVGVEHRYYGQSQPRPNLSVENLQWLSAEQALADAAEIILAVQKEFKAEKSPIITFGCSYSGALAGWFRLKYPHITMGAVASSAPIEAVVDFWQYATAVQRATEITSGTRCGNIIKFATAEIEQLLKSSQGRETVRSKFKLCSALNGANDDANFMQLLFENWQTIVQYNLRNPSYNVSKSCEQLIDASNRMSMLEAYITISNNFLKTPCLDTSYPNLVKRLQSGTFSDSMRQWTYQTCTEYGYYQTTRADKPQPFGGLVTEKFWVDFCPAVYGRTFKVHKMVSETNIHYGGKRLATSIPNNIIFVNGNIDPWAELSIINPIDNIPMETVYVPGVSHCADFSTVGDAAPPALRTAHQKISSLLETWIAKFKPLA